MLRHNYLGDQTTGAAPEGNSRQDQKLLKSSGERTRGTERTSSSMAFRGGSAIALAESRDALAGRALRAATCRDAPGQSIRSAGACAACSAASAAACAGVSHHHQE